MVSTVCFFDFACTIFRFLPAAGAECAVPSFGGFGTAFLLYAGGAIVLSGITESLAKIAAVTMLVIFRLPLLICYALGVIWLYILYGIMLVLENVGKSEEK